MTVPNKAWTPGKPEEPDADALSEAWQPTRAFRPPQAPASDDAWQPTRAFPSSAGVVSGAQEEPSRFPDAWQSTRAQTALATQLFRDEEEYLSGEDADVGRQTGANERELFVSCDPAQAMQQQFEHLQPE